MWSVTTSPSTASPRNSRRSFEGWPGVSAHQERWATARSRSSGSPKVWPRRAARPVRASAGGRRSGRASDATRRSAVAVRALEAGADVVDGITDRPEVLEVLVLDAEAAGPLRQLLFDGLDQLDQREGVGLQVVGERRPLGDAGGIDLQDVGQPVPDEREDLGAPARASVNLGVCSHRGARLSGVQAAIALRRALTRSPRASSAATTMPLATAVADEAPCPMTQTPSTPRSIAPP